MVGVSLIVQVQVEDGLLEILFDGLDEAHQLVDPVLHGFLLQAGSLA